MRKCESAKVRECVSAEVSGMTPQAPGCRMQPDRRVRAGGLDGNGKRSHGHAPGEGASGPHGRIRTNTENKIWTPSPNHQTQFGAPRPRQPCARESAKVRKCESAKVRKCESAKVRKGVSALVRWCVSAIRRASADLARAAGAPLPGPPPQTAWGRENSTALRTVRANSRLSF